MRAGGEKDFTTVVVNGVLGAKKAISETTPLPPTITTVRATYGGVPPLSLPFEQPMGDWELVVSSIKQQLKL